MREERFSREIGIAGREAELIILAPPPIVFVQATNCPELKYRGLVEFLQNLTHGP